MIFVSLFIVVYWFYELGAPLGLSTPRLAAEADAQQVDRRRARLQPVRGELRPLPRAERARPEREGAATVGYIGPQLNAQEKLFAHLNESYLETS